jgi:hypothetical protein
MHRVPRVALTVRQEMRAIPLQVTEEIHFIVARRFVTVGRRLEAHLSHSLTTA